MEKIIRKKYLGPEAEFVFSLKSSKGRAQGTLAGHWKQLLQP
jgi:hypothetical protein